MKYLLFTAVASAGTNACNVYFFKPDTSDSFMFTFVRGMKDTNKVYLAKGGNRPYSHAQTYKAISHYLVDNCSDLTFNAANQIVYKTARAIAQDYLVDNDSQDKIVSNRSIPSLCVLASHCGEQLGVHRINVASHNVKLSATPFYDIVRPEGNLIEIPFQINLEDDFFFPDREYGIVHELFLKTLWGYDAQKGTLTLVEAHFILGEYQLLGFGLDRNFLITLAVSSMFIPWVSSEFQVFGNSTDYVKVACSLNAEASRNILAKILESSQHSAEVKDFLAQRRACYK